jgi:hypothetical protein
VLGKTGDDITITICDVKPDGSWEACCGAGQGAANCCDSDKFTIGNLTHEYAVQRPWNVEENFTSSLSAGPSSTATVSPSDATCASSANEGPLSNTGAQIGLTAGLGVPLLVALGLLFLERRRRRHAEAKLSGQDQYPSFEHEQEGLGRDTLCSHEVDAHSPSTELSCQRPVQELPH